MNRLACIAAVDRNWAIGYQGKLLADNPEDMKFFRETTKGAVLLMGRKTLESFPGGRPLKGRVNLVLSASQEPSFREEAGTVLIFRQTIKELLACAESYPERSVFVIGGGSIYRQFLPFCSIAYITRMEAEFPADTWFPDLDRDPDWSLAEEGEEKQGDGFSFRFCRYERNRLENDMVTVQNLRQIAKTDCECSHSADCFRYLT